MYVLLFASHHDSNIYNILHVHTVST